MTMSPSSYNNRQIRKRRRRCGYRLIFCSVVFFLSSITTSSVVCVATDKFDSHNYINQHRLPASSRLSLTASSPLSFRGGSSSANSQRNQSSLSKNENNIEKSPFEYIPINSLNNYGQSTQLRHAMEAASRYGTPIIACLCSVDEEDESVVCNTDDVEIMDKSNGGTQQRENAIVICSLQRPRLGVVAPSVPIGSTSTSIRRYSTNATPNKVHPSIQGLVKILATRDDDDDAATQTNRPRHTLHTAIVSTGIQSDATFLLSQLQRHFSKFWFRYNTLPSNTLAVVKMIQAVLLDCMGYDWSEEVGSANVSGGVGSAAPSYNESEDESNNGSSAAGRPLGLSSFLLSLASSDDATTTLSSSSFAPRPTITLIEANGSSEQYVARAMGAGAQKANELLSQKWKRGMSLIEVKDMVQEVLREVAIERGWLPSHDEDTSSGSTMHTELTIACETLTIKGIDIEFLPLQRVNSGL